MIQLSLIPRVVVILAFVGQVMFAAGWLWLMPKGFGPGHVRFWTNVAWPSAILAVCIAGVWSIVRNNIAGLKLCLGFVGVVALSGATSAYVVFPDIVQNVIQFGAAVGIVELATAALITPRRMSAKPVLISAVPAIALGAFLPWGLRAERPTTQPINESAPWGEIADAGSFAADGESYRRVSDRVVVTQFDNSVELTLGRVKLSVAPLLSFESTSPSGGWTSLSETNVDRSPDFGRLTGFAQRDVAEGRANDYIGPRDRLRVIDRGPTKTGGPIEITGYSTLDKPIYSHLNSFCRLSIYGHRRLQLEFSPCGALRFDPKPADYPTGRPARFAYCDAERNFHVVEATSGEKGPFESLGEGRLEPGMPLTIGFVDDDARVATIRFDDWSRQLSTALSPTAGWGVAVNAIEFQEVHGSDDSKTVVIWMTLAGTSVGRGWDSVGHSAGTYRNRIVVDAANLPKAAPVAP